MPTRQVGDHLTLREDGREIRLWLEPPEQADTAPIGLDALAILLAPALADKTAASAVATALLATFHSLSGVFGARHDRLAAVPGMTVAAIRSIMAAHDLACLAAQETIAEREMIGDPDDLERYVRLKLRGCAIEAVFGLFLNRKNRLIAEVRLAEGTVDQVQVYPREVVRQALALDASAVILVHNYPSGGLNPSHRYVAMTNQIAAALATINVALHDHLIVGDQTVVSLRQTHAF